MVQVELERFRTTCAIYAYSEDRKALKEAYAGAVTRQAYPGLWCVRVAGYTLDDEAKALDALAEEKDNLVLRGYA